MDQKYIQDDKPLNWKKNHYKCLSQISFESCSQTAMPHFSHLFLSFWGLSFSFFRPGPEISNKQISHRCFVWQWRNNMSVLVGVGVGSASLPRMNGIFDRKLGRRPFLGLASIWSLTRFITRSQSISKEST